MTHEEKLEQLKKKKQDRLKELKKRERDTYKKNIIFLACFCAVGLGSLVGVISLLLYIAKLIFTS